CQRASHRQRYGQHDGERVAETLELRRENQIDEGKREPEHQPQAGGRLLELARLSGIVDLRGWRQQLSRDLLQIFERLSDRVAGREIGFDRRRAPLIEMVELAR